VQVEFFHPIEIAASAIVMLFMDILINFSKSSALSVDFNSEPGLKSFHRFPTIPCMDIFKMALAISREIALRKNFMTFILSALSLHTITAQLFFPSGSFPID